jgi:hypothetical protein
MPKVKHLKVIVEGQWSILIKSNKQRITDKGQQT